MTSSDFLEVVGYCVDGKIVDPREAIEAIEARKKRPVFYLDVYMYVGC